MTNDDERITLRAFYEPEIAKCQAYMDAANYQLTFDALYEALDRGDIARFNYFLALRYKQVAFAVLGGAPDCDREAVEANDRLLDRLISGELSWDAVDFQTYPLNLK